MKWPIVIMALCIVGLLAAGCTQTTGPAPGSVTPLPPAGTPGGSLVNPTPSAFDDKLDTALTSSDEAITVYFNASDEHVMENWDQAAAYFSQSRAMLASARDAFRQAETIAPTPEDVNYTQQMALAHDYLIKSLDAEVLQMEEERKPTPNETYIEQMGDESIDWYDRAAEAMDNADAAYMTM